jgi:Calcineurin-like phosphoesterase
MFRYRVWLASALFLVALLCFLGACGGCEAVLEAVPEPTPASWSEHATAARVVAIGDLHGDLSATRAALKLAGAIDGQDRWIGGALVLVQAGDQLDRGGEDRAVFDLFQRLMAEAPKSGGKVLPLLGNHETMNAEGRMNYVATAGFSAFEGLAGLDLGASWLEAHSKSERARRAAFAPGGPYARMLATRAVVTQVGDTLFAHGGVGPEHVQYGLARINAETRRWLLGQAAQPAHSRSPSTGPLWSYLYAQPAPDPATCAALGRMLTSLGARRLVVGHVIQKRGITSACAGKVWRVDVGMSSFYEDAHEVQVLELVGGKQRVLE